MGTTRQRGQGSQSYGKDSVGCLSEASTVAVFCRNRVFQYFEH